MDNATLVILTISTLVISILYIIVVKFRKALARHYSRLDSIPSQVYHSKHGDIEYLLQGDGPTILVSHGITGGVDQGARALTVFLSLAR